MLAMRQMLLLSLSIFLLSSTLFWSCGTDTSKGETNTEKSSAESTSDASAATESTPEKGCDSGKTSCNGACVDTQSDDKNCGSCGAECKGGQKCAAGKCACPGQQEFCSDTCIDTQTDIKNCGECAYACKTGQLCSKGKCSDSCGAGETKCGSSCVKTDSNTKHCGKCDNTCGADQTCNSGKCECGSGKTLCGSACVDSNTDNNNCGACGTKCAAGQSCKAGKCEGGSSSCAPDPGFKAKVVPVITASCSCHTQSGSGGLAMGDNAESIYKAIVNAKSSTGKEHIKPGDVKGSYFIDKIEGTMSKGRKMPIGGQLSAADIKIIKDWVCNGAKNN